MEATGVRGPSLEGSRDSDSDRGMTEAKSQSKGAAAAPAKGSRWPNRKLIILAIVLGCILVLGLALGLGLGLGLKKKHHHVSPPQTTKPNVVVIMTDDQDLLLDSMSVMPNVKQLVAAQGVTYDKHYCTVAWCCPSRVNFLTGRAAHNTNVTATLPPYGGWQKFSQVGLNSNYLPVWINQTGIGTYYVGKFMNGYSTTDFANPAYPDAWTDSSFLVDPYTYNYFHSHWTNGYTTKITDYPGIHTTDVTQTKALAMLDQAVDSGNQFFMMVAPVAPHQELTDGTFPPPIPKQWKGVFNNRTAPRTENFNPVNRSGASWVYDFPRLDSSQLKVCDTTYYHRLGNIAAIDVMVQQLIERLDHYGILNNTYIVYTTDNGFHIGNHRLLPGKRCPYEEDINIPLLIRGPGVAQNVTSNIANSHTDMAPTILKMLGVPLRDDFDGAPIAYTNDELSTSTKNEIVNVEFWNADNAPIGVAGNYYYNNTYKAIRVMNNQYNLYYSTWCTGEREFYDMSVDSQQMNNLLGINANVNPSVTYYGRPQAEMVSRMDALLMVMKTCKQDSCRDPWSILFPNDQVGDLGAAMAASYDAFFSAQPKVTFKNCDNGYLAINEGPVAVNAYQSGSQQVLA